MTMSTVYSRPQLSPSELRCSPHTTYYTNFFVLRTAVTINGQEAEIVFSENKQLTLNCRYPSTKCVSITFHTISSQVEAVLNKYGVSHVSNFWLGEVLFLQVGFSCEHSLRTFLRSRQEMQREVGVLFSARLREGQPSTASASPVSHGFPVEVETDLFLVLPDAEDKTRAVSLENCSSFLALWKESEKFDFGALFRTLKLKAGEVTVKGELSVNVLVSELSDVVEWFTFGLYLGVPTSDLLRIDRERPSIMERLSIMLDWWVKNGEQPTWSAVVRALFGIRMRGLAEKITVKYAVPREAQMAVSTATDTLHTHITAAGSQTVPIQLSANIQQAYSRLEERDEELTRVSESLPAAKKRKMAAGRKYTQAKKKLTAAKASTETLVTERDAARRQLEVEEGELRFLKRLRKTEKKNEELQAIIAEKEKRIAQLKKQLAGKERELSLAREEVQKLTKQLQQTTMELAEKSTQVHEMEIARSENERERNRADIMVKQLCATNQGLLSQLERVTPAELDTLKQAVQEKEEEVGRLSSQLKAKKTEEQMLLAQAERQSQQVADELVEVKGELCEVRSRLMEAEDGRMRAEVKLEDLKSRKSVVSTLPGGSVGDSISCVVLDNVRLYPQQPDPHNCKAVGRGLQFGETNQIAEFQVHLTDANGELCVERQEVRAELKSLVDGSITQAEVSHQTRSADSYEVSYQPSIRGRHELSVLVNDVAITGSSFKVYVQQPPQLMGRPVRVISVPSQPRRATLSSSGQLIVTEYSSGRMPLFDGQGKLIRWIYPQHSRFSMKLTGVAIDDSGIMYVCDGSTHKLYKVSSTGEVLKSVGGEGSGPGQLDSPDGIALRDNRLYICDNWNHRIQIFSCDLNFISSFGSYGRGEGKLSYPRDIALDQEGNMYVVERDNHRVQVFSPSGTFLRTFGKRGSGSGEMSRPRGIHVDHNIVYITDYDNHRISIFTTLGEYISSIVRRGSKKGKFWPFGITMNCDGFLYVCDRGNYCIQIF